MTHAPAQAAMSIDVEDWFQVENLRPVIDKDTWDEQPSRVVENTTRMLDIMAERGVCATCFILGWVADRHPNLVKRIADHGHEIACHGYGHDLIYTLSRDDFREDVRRAKAILEDQTGQPVRGYRAPSFSITDWAIDVLQEEGFAYDSSAFPTLAHDRYGKLSGMDAGEPITEIRPGFWELCISTLTVGAKGIPWGGGGYFRLFPKHLFLWGVKRILRAGAPYVFYIHPWEIDPGQPRQRGLSRTNAFRHYVNLHRCEGRFAELLDAIDFGRMDRLLSVWQEQQSTQQPTAGAGASPESRAS